MNIEIKTIGGSLLFSGDFSCIAEAVKAALTAKTDLSSANLRSADLRSADLSSANLRYANLRSADLRYANLSSANLRSADLSSADLSSADLSSADLSSADLSSAENAEMAIAVTRICPEGNLIGWKKLAGGIIAKLLIPTDAKRNNAFGRKCRCEFARVLELSGGAASGQTNGSHGPVTVYTVGEIVRPDKWDGDFQNECSNGIHFFITRLEAEAY
jgi:hypothetical protein